MDDFLAVDALVQGILQADTATKQKLGQRFAVYLGIEAGPSGGDEGIDGWGQIGDKRIYFQSKLVRNRLDASKAADFYGNLHIHQATVGLILSGAGFTSGFMQRLEKDPDLHRKFEIHCLSLADLFEETPAFLNAITDLPPLENLADGRWKNLLS